MRHARPPRHARGVSLVEACVVVAVLGVVVSIAAPSFGWTRQRVELNGVAAQLETDIQFTRSEAVSRAEPLRIAFGNSADGSCYVIHTGAANACRCGSGPDAECDDGAEALKLVQLQATGGVQLQSNVRTMAFDGVRGTVSPAGTVRVIGRDGRAVHQVVNAMGRVRSCSPQRSVPGYSAC